jgi:hypothetical protein
VRTDPKAAIANAHKQMKADGQLPRYKLFVQDTVPNHAIWMQQHGLLPEQLVVNKPIILEPVNARHDGSRAALSVAVIPFDDLQRLENELL